MSAKLLNVQSLLWLALALALAGSLKHLAAIFASVDGNTFMGWLQAIAIDAGLFALAYSIKKRKVDKRTTKPLWFGVALFSVISIYGNLAYGLLSTTGQLPGWLGAIKPYLLAASLPVLVLFLSELLSDDRQHANEQAKKLDRKQPRQEANGIDSHFVTTSEGTVTNGGNGSVTENVTGVTLLDKANEVKAAKVVERRQQVLTMLQSGDSENAISESLGVSVRTIRRDIAALNGKVMTQ